MDTSENVRKAAKKKKKSKFPSASASIRNPDRKPKGQAGRENRARILGTIARGEA